MESIFRDNYRKYRDLNLVVLPCPRNSKGPVIKGWNKNPPPTNYPLWERKNAKDNIWVRLDGVLVFDPDHPNAERFVQELGLPECPLSVSGNKSIHRWFKNPNGLKPLKVTIEDDTWLEVRTGGQGMVVAPSVHPETGKPYEWIVSPWEFKKRHGVYFPELPQEVYEKIKALQEKHEPSPKMEPAQAEDNSLGHLDVAKYLNHYGIKFKTKPGSDRIIYTLERCLFADQHTTKDGRGDSSIIQGSDGKLGFCCFHNHCTDKTWHDAREAISGDNSIAQFCEGYKPPKGKESTQLKPVITARDLERMELTEATAVIEKGLLPAQGGVVLAGPSGIGKSILCNEMAIRLCRGIDIFGFRVPKPRRVLIVQKENALAQVKHRTTRVRKGLSLPHAPENLFLTPVSERFNLQRREDIERLSQYIRSVTAEVTILDPLSSFHTKDENDNIAMRNILDGLTDISRMLGVAFLVVHHYGKGNEYRGATAIKDWADTLIGFEERTDTQRALRFVKVRNGPRPRTIVVEMDNDFIHQIVGGSTYYVKKALEEMGGQAESISLLTKALMSKFGYQERTARSHVYDAFKDRVIEKREDPNDRRRKSIVLCE